jgi:hypothetical protein
VWRRCPLEYRLDLISLDEFNAMRGRARVGPRCARTFRIHESEDAARRRAAGVRSGPIREGSWVRVRLRPGCDGGRRPHHPAEDQMRGQVSSVDHAGDHSVFMLYRGGGSNVPRPEGGLGVAVHSAPTSWS